MTDKVNRELVEKYSVGELINTKYGFLPIIGFMEFKHYGGDDSMMLPYVEYDGDKYTFDVNENVNEARFLIKIIED